MGELALQGVSAAPGVVAGGAIALGGFASAADEVTPPERRADELERAMEALDAEVRSLTHIAAELHKRGWPDDAEIVETGVLMARDPGLLARIEALVAEAGLSAPAALKAATEESANLLARVGDTTLAQRADDVRSLGRRAVAHAIGAELIPGGVLIATNLGAAAIADLGLAARRAALVEGGVTAHGAIVSPCLGVPMFVGLC